MDLHVVTSFNDVFGLGLSTVLGYTAFKTQMKILLLYMDKKLSAQKINWCQSSLLFLPDCANAKQALPQTL